MPRSDQRSELLQILAGPATAMQQPEHIDAAWLIADCLPST
jgi:hypothetical protein